MGHRKGEMSSKAKLQRALEMARSLPTIEDHDRRIDLVEEIGVLAGFEEREVGASPHDLVPIEAFDPLQQEILRLVARHHGTLVGDMAVGVPWHRFDLLAWSGAEEPRVLESVAPGAPPMPRWLVLQKMGLAGSTWAEARANALRGLDAVQSLDATFLVSVGAYGLEELFESEGLATAVEEALAEAGERGNVYARALLERLAPMADFSMEVGIVNGARLEPLLRAAHRAGGAIAKRFHNMIPWTARNRPLLAALSPEERAALVIKKTRSWGAPNLEMEMDNLEALADLLVTPELLTHLRGIIEGDEELESLYAARLDALGRRFA